MMSSRTHIIFFSVLFIAVAVLLLLIFQPFLTVIALSAMVAVILYPIYNSIVKDLRGQKTLAAFFTLIFLLVVIILPLATIGRVIISEAQSMYVHIASGGDVSLSNLNTAIDSYVKKIYPSFSFNIQTYLAYFSSWIVNNLGGFFSGTVNFALKLILMFVSVFYFLRDSDSFKKQITDFSPLKLEDTNEVFKSLKSSINSVILGSIINAIIQGVLLSIGFTLFGIPNATLWGTTAAIVSFVPAIGTGLIWVPGVIYLFFARGGYWWIYQIIWSAITILLFDNYIAPKVIERTGIHFHPLLILFSILGGLSFFGPDGFLFGPLVLTLFSALVKVYQKSGTN